MFITRSRNFPICFAFPINPFLPPISYDIRYQSNESVFTRESPRVFDILKTSYDICQTKVRKFIQFYKALKN